MIFLFLVVFITIPIGIFKYLKTKDFNQSIRIANIISLVVMSLLFLWFFEETNFIFSFMIFIFVTPLVIVTNTAIILAIMKKKY